MVGITNSLYLGGTIWYFIRYLIMLQIERSFEMFFNFFALKLLKNPAKFL